MSVSSSKQITSNQDTKKADDPITIAVYKKLKETDLYLGPMIYKMKGSVDIPSEVVVPYSKSIHIVKRNAESQVENECYDKSFPYDEKVVVDRDPLDQEDEHSISSFITVETTEALVEVGTILAQEKLGACQEVTSPMPLTPTKNDLFAGSKIDHNNKTTKSVNLQKECLKQRHWNIVVTEETTSVVGSEKSDKDEHKDDNNSDACTSYSTSEASSGRFASDKTRTKASASTFVQNNSVGTTSCAKDSSYSFATVQRGWESISKELGQMPDFSEYRDIPSLQKAIDEAREEVEGARQDLTSAVNQIWHAFSLNDHEINAFVEKIDIPIIDFPGHNENYHVVKK